MRRKLEFAVALSVMLIETVLLLDSVIHIAHFESQYERPGLKVAQYVFMFLWGAYMLADSIFGASGKNSKSEQP